VVDTAGNPSPESFVDIIKDTTAPGAPVLVIADDLNNDQFLNVAELDGKEGLAESYRRSDRLLHHTRSGKW